MLLYATYAIQLLFIPAPISIKATHSPTSTSKNPSPSSTHHSPPTDSPPSGTNTYLLGSGRTRLLIDTGQGFPAWHSRLSALLTAENCTISHALLTHWHDDHVSGVPDLLSICPSARIHKHSPSLAQGENAIADGDNFSVEGATLRALHCPGHTADHMAFVLEEEAAMFTGDNVLGHGTAVFESLAEYLASLGRMMELGGGNGRAYPGHGDVVRDRNAKIEEYIRHRRQREEEVLEALREEERTAMEVVEVVYKAYPRDLWEPARGGVMQILW